MPKLFVSLPMANREIDDIRADMEAIRDIVSAEMDDDFELLDTCWDEEPDSDISNNPGSMSAWYLGKSIMALAEADLAVFDSEWSSARGCIIEHMLCALYGIPYVDLSMSYSNDSDDLSDVQDYTVDYNEAAQINEKLSENYEDALGFEHDDILEPGEYDADVN